MSHLPLVSVVIPAFNMSRYIARTIASVLEQSYKEIELIIVDDGSTDDTGLIVRNITAKNIIYIFQDNKGLPAARNAGIKASKGDFIAFLDADDYWHPKKSRNKRRCSQIFLKLMRFTVIFFGWMSMTTGYQMNGIHPDLVKACSRSCFFIISSPVQLHPLWSGQKRCKMSVFSMKTCVTPKTWICGGGWHTGTNFSR